MVHHIKLIAALLAFSLSASLSYGQQGLQPYSYEQLLSTSGISCSTVNVMTRDAKGRLWLGLPTGAAVFSNGNVTSVKTLSVDNESRYIGTVTSIACGQRTLLASDDYLVDYDFDNNSALVIKNPEGKKVITEYLMVKDENAIFYEQSTGRLYLYSFALRTLRILYSFPEEENYRFRKIIDLGEDRYVLADDNKGMVLLDAKSGKHSPICRELGTSLRAKTAFVGSDGILWAFWASGGLVGVDVNDAFRPVRNLPPRTMRFTVSDINSISELPDGRISVTTAGYGVFLIDPLTGQAERLNIDILKNAVGTYVNDENSDLIFPTLYDGIVIRKQSFMQPVTGIDQNLLSRSQTTCASQGDDGRIWFGTTTRGVIVYDEGTGRMFQVPGSEGRRVLGLCRYDADHMLVTVPHQGAYILDTRTLEYDEADMFSRIGQMTISTPSGYLLSFNGRDGHFGYDPASGTRRSIDITGLPDDMSVVKHAVPLLTGAILASESSVYFLDYGTFDLTRIYCCPSDDANGVRSVAGDSRDRIWIVANSSLFRYDPKDGEIYEAMSRSSLGGMVSVTTDSFDRLWLASVAGILMRYDPATGETEYFFRSDGIGSSEFIDYYSFLSSSGILYLPKVSGTLRVDTQGQQAEVKSNAFVECISVHQSGTSHKYTDMPRKTPLVSISGGKGDVEVGVAVHTANPVEPVFVQYQLMHYSRPVFTLMTTDDVFKLPKMVSGTYTLHARILGRKGLGEDSEILSLKVSRSVFSYSWIYLLFAALLTYLAIVYTRRSMTKDGKSRKSSKHAADAIKKLNIPVPRYNDVEFETTNLSLMVVDDDPDVCSAIKDKLSSKFKYVYSAPNGSSGLDLALDRRPDVILTEVVLPQMNGFELCRAIKGEQTLLSTIVVFLTDSTSTESQTIAYRMGCDGFVPKPFQAEALYGVVKAILKNHNDVKIRYSSSSLMTGALSEKSTYTSSDEQFVVKLNEFIKSNLSNPELGVDMIVDHMCVSRTTLFNKMNSLLGTSAVKYIRRMRLEVAKDLLSNTDKTIGEIALETGFTESQYFSTVFKQETGVPPSAFRK